MLFNGLLSNNTFRSIQFNLNCSNELVILNFQNLFKLDKKNLRTYAIVIPDGATFDDDKNKFCHLLNVLKINNQLTAVAGKSLFPWHPICTMERNGWTLSLFHEYSKFADGSNIVQNKIVGNCYPCDLLPDYFVINLSHLTMFHDLKKLESLAVSGHVPFFMKLKGRLSYCPDYKIRYNYSYSVEDLSCNNLYSRWDERFPLIPNITGIYRIINPNGVEAWLGCVWIKSAYVLNLTIHCSNLIGQYLFDVVDILEKVLKVDYRIIHGTLLGALRDNKLIPWSADADIYPLVSTHDFGDFYDKKWRQLPNLSNRRYSYSGKDGDEHLDYAFLEAVRAFPMCPVILTSRNDSSNESVYNVTRNQLISQQIIKQNSIKRTNISKHDHWRNSGYVDIYTSSHLSECYTDPLNKKFIWIKINGKNFKTFSRAKEFVTCIYGANASENLPKHAKTDWTWFMD